MTAKKKKKKIYIECEALSKLQKLECLVEADTSLITHPCACVTHTHAAEPLGGTQPNNTIRVRNNMKCTTAEFQKVSSNV